MSRPAHISLSLSKLVIAGLAVLITLLNFNHHKWNRQGEVIQWDVISYYAYLPAVFIYHDIDLDFRDENIDKFANLVWPLPTPTGKKAIVTSMGMSYLYAPFFFIAHGVALVTNYEPDGYSVPYRFALVFSALFYLILGLIFLRKVLRYYFTENVTAVVLVTVVLGTNLLYYSVYEAPMSHAYSFSLIAIFIFLTRWFFRKPGAVSALLIGLVSGLIALIRPTNIIILLILLLWDITSWKSFVNRIVFFLRRIDLVLLMVLLFFAVWVPQFLYWHHVSGKYLYFSYGAIGGKFFWKNPQFWNILFSYKKGWLVYTPVMLFTLAGLFWSSWKQPAFLIPVLVYFIINLYILASWWSWWFGGCYGNRAFIDSYALLALPLGVMVEKILSLKRPLRYSLMGSLFVLVLYNDFQIRQYNHGALHYWWMNREAYWEDFLRDKPTGKYWELVTFPDYDMARKGIYREILPDLKIEISEKQVKKSIQKAIADTTVNHDNLSLLVDSIYSVRHDYYRKKMILNFLEKKIRDNPSLMRQYKKEAKKEKINMDSVIRHEACYLIQKYEYK
ncbi:MAG: hypothetical protein GXO83_11305 [Chlorobi bacterium]|nr:hypothetical protein [Chlorobiota bacterium]